MRMAYHRKKDKNYVQYTLRIEENILNKMKDIAKKEKISINEVFNQSLNYAVTDYEKTKSH